MERIKGLMELFSETKEKIEKEGLIVCPTCGNKLTFKELEFVFELVMHLVCKKCENEVKIKITTE